MQQRENIPDHLHENARLRGFVGGRSVSFRLEVPVRRSREEAWQLLEQKISGGKVIPLRRKRLPLRALVMTGAAATLALLMTLSFLLFHYGNRSVSSVTGETYTLLLPDSSEVTLNGSSSLRYNRLLWPVKREVSLRGEAFFRVRKGKRFTVTTRRGSVTVLGTRFSVLSRDDRFRVMCYSGRVSVVPEKKGGNRIVLTPGLQTESSSAGNLVEPREFDPTRQPLWHKPGHYFSNTPLDKVLKAFARQYNVRLSYEREITHDRYYTGTLPENNMESALKMICLPMGLRYTLENNNIKITRNI